MRTTTRTTAGLLNRIALATALIAAAPAMTLALPSTEAPDIELYLSGATAQDEVLENLLRLNAGIEGAPNICEPGTLDIYRGVIAGTGKRLYFCRTSDRIPGVAARRRLAIHKSSGGSGEGVGPLAAREAVAYLDLRALPEPRSCQEGLEVRAVGDLAAYREHRACDGGGRLMAPLLSGFLPPRAPVTAEKLRENPVTGVSKSLNELNNCEEPILLNASHL